jgi:hypothetical protein
MPENLQRTFGPITRLDTPGGDHRRQEQAARIAEEAARTSLSSEATRIRPDPGIRPERMKNYLLRIAHELGVPVTVRRVPGGVLF